MAQPFRVIDGDDPGNDRGGWDEGGNVDLPGTLTVNTIQGSGSSTPALTTVTIAAQLQLQAAISVIQSLLALQGATATSDLLSLFVVGDGFARFRGRADGRFSWGPGNAARDTFLYRSGVNALQTDGFLDMASGQSDGAFSVFGGSANSLKLGTAGGGLGIAEGSNARMGLSTLTGGTVVVANTSVTANTRIFLTCQTPGGTPGFLRVSTRTAATSFTILSSSGTDTSAVAWLLVEPQ
jgi:hypothetical protein